jgi:hypothetical protein
MLPWSDGSRPLFHHGRAGRGGCPVSTAPIGDEGKAAGHSPPTALLCEFQPICAARHFTNNYLCCPSLREGSKRSQLRVRLTPRPVRPLCHDGRFRTQTWASTWQVSGPSFSTAQSCGRSIETSTQCRKLPAWWSGWAIDVGDAYDRNRLHRDQYSDRLDLLVRGGDERATEVLTLSHLGVGQDCKNPKSGHDDYHRENCRRESFCIDHGHDLAADGQRHKLANGLAAFALTRVRLRKFWATKKQRCAVFAAIV